MDTTEAARLLGMKAREIIAINPVDGGWLITTHDQRRTLVNKDGQVLGPAESATSALVRQPKPGTVEHAQVTSLRQETEAEVPAGTVDEVLAWVAGDPQRAELAARVESRRDTPRTTLVERLDKIRLAQGKTGG